MGHLAHGETLNAVRLNRATGVLFWLALMIVYVGAAWESAAIDRIWFYAPSTIVGLRFLRIPLEEWGYYMLDALLVGTLALALMKAALARSVQGVRTHV